MQKSGSLCFRHADSSVQCYLSSQQVQRNTFVRRVYGHLFDDCRWIAVQIGGYDLHVGGCPSLCFALPKGWDYPAAQAFHFGVAFYTMPLIVLRTAEGVGFGEFSAVYKAKISHFPL